MLIEENKKKELRKKMQSAGFIRKDHGKAKVFFNIYNIGNSAKHLNGKARKH